jgi:glycosyltransferase involved in cell wall biosynthesis
MSPRHRDHLEKLWPPVTTKTALIPAPPLLRIVDDGDGSVRKRGRVTWGVTGNQLLVAYFGYVYRGKGLEFLLRAVKLAQATVKDVRLLLIGGVAHPDYETELRKLACELGIEDRVMWTGRYEPEAEGPSVFLRAADICALPFDAGVHLNNSSFAVAAAHGLATITTAGTDIEPEFEDGVNAWLCPPRDPRALADAIKALAADPALRERLGAGAHRLADQCFSWTRTIDGTLAILRGEDPRPFGAFGIHRPDPGT